MSDLEYVCLQIIWNAALNAGPYINDLTDEKFYEAFNDLNEYLASYLLDK
jgi:hypothetical protein